MSTVLIVSVIAIIKMISKRIKRKDELDGILFLKHRAMDEE